MLTDVPENGNPCRSICPGLIYAACIIEKRASTQFFSCVWVELQGSDVANPYYVAAHTCRFVLLHIESVEKATCHYHKAVQDPSSHGFCSQKLEEARVHRHLSQLTIDTEPALLDLVS